MNEPIPPSSDNLNATSPRRETSEGRSVQGQEAGRQGQISLPKGGGAIQGITESFKANSVTGTASFSIPLPVSPARGFQPDLSLSYDSGSGNSPFGLGWSLGIPQIRRRTEKGLPRYLDGDESDIFMLGGGEELVPLLRRINGEWQQDLVEKDLAGVTWQVRLYRPRIEGSFARIERWRHPTTGISWWRITSPDNVTSVYGYRASARIEDPDQPHRVFSWLIDCQFDDKGNYTQFDYKSEDLSRVEFGDCFESNRAGRETQPQRYLKRVLYGIRESTIRQGLRLEDLITSRFDPGQFHFQTVFDYGEHIESPPRPEESDHPWTLRHDPFSDYRAGFEVRTWRQCRRVLLFHQFDDELLSASELVQAVSFEYEDETAGFSFLKGIRFTGYKRDESGELASKSLPDLTFSYQQHAWNTRIENVDPDSIENLPAGVDGRQYQWTDLRNEGLSGVLSEHAGELHYKSNRGAGRFGAAELVSPAPSLRGLASGALQVRDLDANGKKQLVSMQARGFFPLEEDGWGNFENFVQLPNVDLTDPNLRVIDLTGDGRADLVISEESAFRWYPSVGTKGHGEARRTARAGDEKSGPAIAFSDSTESIFLADMSGDGLQDIVRIRNGSVVYWPNLGYGRFGAKVTMGEAPWFDHPDQFTARNIRLGDLDGSGTADLVYLGKNEFRYWLNRSGNRWADPIATINPFADMDLLTDVSVIDLMGSGTACIVWTSPAPRHRGQTLRYIDLMAGTKPHVMVNYRNGMGKEVRLEYTPSTRFYLDDQARGEPWITRLHFPVQCLSGVETIDHVTGARFASHYTYHHGYYDHVEREFRGFGRVDQVDSESFDHFARGESSNVVERVLHQAPVMTRTWFHTGVWIDRERIFSQYRSEYFAPQDADDGEVNPLAKFRLPEPVVPDDLTTAEHREALRACKGLALRTEVYGLDGSDLEAVPYSIAETTAEIRAVQPRNDQRCACFQVLNTESLSLQLDRNPGDPRISHNLVLASGPYGNPTISAAVGYGRLESDDSLPGEVSELQRQCHVVVSTADFTLNDTGILGEFDPHLPLGAEKPYRLPVAWNTGAFELIPEQVPENALFDRALLLEEFDGATPVGYEDTARDEKTRRLISRSETRFINETLNGPRPGGEMSPLGIPWKNYQLAFTPALIDSIYQRRVDRTSFEGGYVDLHSDGNWWVPAGTPIFGAAAAERFYLPDGSRDPLGTPSWLTFDDYLLLPVRARDARENESLAINDYRTLSAKFVRDANHNWVAVEVDALGMVIASATMGKLTGPRGDEAPEANSECQGDNLKNPGVEFSYDLEAWSREQKPASVTTIAWEEHHFQNQERQLTQVSHEYTGGAGSVIMVKAQAEPGLALQVEADGTMVEVDTRTPDPPQLRWICKGRTVFNNKGNPVKQYEPYFSVTPDYEDEIGLVGIGVTPILFYDAAGRHDCRLNPNHTYEKVVFSPWRQANWDVNDTLFLKDEGDTIETNPAFDPDVGHYFEGLAESEYRPTWYEARINDDLGPDQKRAAEITSSHVATPAKSHTDSLGRTVYGMADNGSHGTYETLSRLDIEGNLLSVIDDRDNAVMTYRYSMLPPPDEENPKPAIHEHGMDGGEKWTLTNVLGQPIRSWDSRAHLFEIEYDELSRPVRSWVTEDGDRKLVGATRYRDSNLPDAGTFRTANLIGAADEAFDQAGRTQTVEIDFKGNVLVATRTLASAYKETVNWDAADRESLLEPEQFTTVTKYDALNRVTWALSPHHASLPASVTRPTYGASGGLDKMQVSIRSVPGGVLDEETLQLDTYVENIDYDAKGQRRSIEYGNGVTTTYEYEDDTFRLKRLLTIRTADNVVLQDLNYTHDPVGNITGIRDHAQQTIYFNGEVVEPVSTYEYDPLYQLRSATGREHIGQNSSRPPTPFDGWDPLPHSADGQAMRGYLQEYEYDGVGNIREMAHRAAGGGYTRYYDYEENNNRLRATTTGDPDLPFTNVYSYNAHGSMTSMPHLPVMDWDFAEQLSHVNLAGGGDAWYAYDAGGQRVRKIVESNRSLVKERIYLGGWEIYRERNASGLRLERETLHVMDDQNRIALVETRTQGGDGTGGSTPVTRYQLSNHLGSASLELGATGDVISYEEFHPYGTTAFHAGTSVAEASRKRYRYTGKERDEETGFSYHGARYLAPWLGRWTAVDPSGVIDGPNLFLYSRANPVRFIDPAGKSAWEVKRAWDPTIDAKGYEKFAKKEFKRMQSEKGGDVTLFNHYDCADLAVRFYVRYAASEGLEVRFKHAATGQTISSSDSGLYYGDISVDRLAPSDRIKMFELIMRANVGATNMKSQGLVYEVGPEKGRAGDIMLTPSHAQVALSQFTEKTESELSEEDLKDLESYESYGKLYEYSMATTSSGGDKVTATGIESCPHVREDLGLDGIKIRYRRPGVSPGRIESRFTDEGGTVMKASWSNFVFRWSTLRFSEETVIPNLIGGLPDPSWSPGDQHFYLHLVDEINSDREPNVYTDFLESLSESELEGLTENGQWNFSALYALGAQKGFFQ